MANAIMAPARFTNDSRASESNPTDPVNRQASIFITMVTIAAVIDSRTKGFRDFFGREMECITDVLNLCKAIASGKVGRYRHNALKGPHVVLQ
ncbi:hypothetical protein [Pelodictyon luteolum]|uniref:hypothetical protein n=1 Tax=Pelodictyon luteolum TaxID=1100 RepID=UPI003B830DF3